MSRDPDPPDLPPAPTKREPILGQVVIWQDGKGNPIPMNHAQRRAAEGARRRDLAKSDEVARKKAQSKWWKEERARRRADRAARRRAQKPRHKSKARKVS